MKLPSTLKSNITHSLNYSILSIALLFVLSTQNSLADYTAAQTFNGVSEANKLLSKEQIRKDVILLKNAYSRLHPGYLRYSNEATLTAAWEAIIQKADAQQGMTVGNFYLEVQEALTLIRCDHTKANLSSVMRKERNEKAMYLPFRWQWINERAFITHSEQQLGLDKFDEIIAIDGRPIKDLVDQVKAYIPYDGFTEWSRNSGISESLEFKGGAIDHFGALLWNVTPKFKITYKNSNNDVKTTELSRINFKQWQALVSDEDNASNFKDAVTFELLDDSTAYLRIDTFVNYRKPVEPSSIYNPIFKTIKDQNMKVLILDLRNNGGGSTDASQGLFANLITEEMQYKLDMFVNTLDFEELRPYLSTWDESALDPWRIAFSKNDNGTYSLRSWFTDDLDTVEPAKYAFDGKIIALTSNNNSSGSTNLLSVIHSTGRVKLVGEKTGGSAEGPTAGVIFTLSLPESKITTRIPMFQYKNNVKSFTRGMGMVPDIETPITVQAFLNDVDPALEAAIKLAK